MQRMKKTQSFLSLTAALALWATTPDHATAGMEPFVGEISYVAFNFAPEGWFQCNGRHIQPASAPRAILNIS